MSTEHDLEYGSTPPGAQYEHTDVDVGIGYSFGGFESLVIPLDPAGARSVRAWPLEGIDAADRLGIRLSIGLEDIDDLVADLEQAFRAMEQA